MKTKSFESFSPGDASMPAYPDEQLVMETLDDSHLAFGQLVKQYQYRVLRTIASIVSDEQAAQDVAQETFLAAWEGLPKLEARHKFGGWLNQIAINLSKRWLRDERKYREDTDSLEEGAIVLTQEIRYQQDKLRQEIWDAIDGLSAVHREVVILHYISGYSHIEIGEMLSIPASTVHGRLQQARSQLRKEFLDMVTKLQLEIDSTVHKFLKERAKRDGLSIEALILRLIEKYSKDAGTSGVITRQIWDNAHDASGTVSPDGRYLSFVNWGTENLAIHDFQTGESRDITDQADSVGFGDISIWSPDSKQIAYLWYEAPEWSTSLRVIGIDGSKSRVLRSSPPKSDFFLPQAWSRDGKYILALHHKTTDETHNHDFVLVSVADGSMRLLKSLDGRPLGNLANLMSLSPDGRYVVYDSLQREGQSNRGIFLLSTDGSHEGILVDHPADNYAPFWTPDGNGIVFASDRSGSIGIWVLEVADGKPAGYPRLINHNLNGMVPLGLAQDGSYYYGLMGGANDIYFAELEPETGEVVAPPTKVALSLEGFNCNASFSPDGKYLAYASIRPKASNIYFRIIVIRSLETGEERELSPENAQLGHIPQWSPDGRSILTLAGGVDAMGKRQQGIYQVDIETNTATPVVLNNDQGPIAILTVWFPDGSKFFFKRRHVDKSIRVYDFETKEEWKPDFRLAHGEGYPYGLAISPDGQELAFMIRCDDQWSLQIAPSFGGDAREIARMADDKVCHGHGLVWSPDGRHLLFYNKLVDKANGLCELLRVPVEGGEPQNLGLTMKHMHLSIHPDGRRIAFTGPGQRPGAEVWVMENFLPGFTASR